MRHSVLLTFYIFVFATFSWPRHSFAIHPQDCALAKIMLREANTLQETPAPWSDEVRIEITRLEIDAAVLTEREYEIGDIIRRNLRVNIPEGFRPENPHGEMHSAAAGASPVEYLHQLNVFSKIRGQEYFCYRIDADPEGRAYRIYYALLMRNTAFHSIIRALAHLPDRQARMGFEFIGVGRLSVGSWGRIERHTAVSGWGYFPDFSHADPRDVLAGLSANPQRHPLAVAGDVLHDLADHTYDALSPRTRQRIRSSAEVWRAVQDTLDRHSGTTLRQEFEERIRALADTVDMGSGKLDDAARAGTFHEERLGQTAMMVIQLFWRRVNHPLAQLNAELVSQRYRNKVHPHLQNTAFLEALTALAADLNRRVPDSPDLTEAELREEALAVRRQLGRWLR